MAKLENSAVEPVITKLNTVWDAAGLFQTTDVTRPKWSGYMYSVCNGEQTPAASIQMLPIIDLKPMDESCILSTLLFVVNQCKKLNVAMPCSTFDQPLYIKAVNIIISTKLNIVDWEDFTH